MSSSLNSMKQETSSSPVPAPLRICIAGAGAIGGTLAVRLSARRRLGRAGRLDFRRTVRASLATGGMPLVTHHRPRAVHKPELVVLCDVSGSVAAAKTKLDLAAWWQQCSRACACGQEPCRIAGLQRCDFCGKIQKRICGKGDCKAKRAELTARSEVLPADLGELTL